MACLCQRIIYGYESDNYLQLRATVSSNVAVELILSALMPCIKQQLL